MNPQEANGLVAASARKCIDALLGDTKLRTATVFVAPTLVVKATRQHKFDGRDRQETYIVTYGRPNYAERHFVSLCKKAGEPLPVKKVQLRLYPTKRGVKSA